MKLLCVHAHYDDYEFVAGGTFEMWRRKLGAELRTKVVVCTDGCGGHQFRTRAETGRLRLEEQLASARVGGYEFELLRLPSGEILREAGFGATTEVLAALWKTIRDFEPDYLFCPPIPRDPLVGVHVDHIAVAEAVRKVAYLINVPHAFTPEYPADETQSTPCKVPVIINVHDGYMGGGERSDLAVEVGPAFELICAMSWCHQSQIREWLPWVGRHDLAAPANPAEWAVALRRRLEKNARGQGLKTNRLLEFFNVTAWGTVPTWGQIERDFPNLVPEMSNFERLRERLDRLA